ncbi:DUF2274 domain-containing protein [Sphingomonas sp. ERG5]|uniref:DUF2274 domain-containing protein n=1 Tax=Sphingomonas sp. ERG5 TaxID=1381597 RepID=UPI00054B3405|nr:DUF2274 domain-containing protein [Sphingomonas sp. ERG5]
MAEVRLAKLPERIPVKLAISIMPDLHQRLQHYAAAYAEAYQSEEPLTERVPAMLAAFLDGDFARRRR